VLTWTKINTNREVAEVASLMIHTTGIYVFNRIGSSLGWTLFLLQLLLIFFSGRRNLALNGY
jgi:hypothetical protein